MSLSKQQRQHLVAQLLERRAVASQSQLVDLLAAEGVAATQATVSRDLDELGAVKIRVAGGDTAYALPELPTRQVVPEDHLRRVLGEWAVEVAASGPLVVVRTPPGSAHVVGSALDRSAFPGVIGTVAGDDTVLVVVEESAGGTSVADTLRTLAGLPVPSGGRYGAGGRPTGDGAGERPTGDGAGERPTGDGAGERNSGAAGADGEGDDA